MSLGISISKRIGLGDGLQFSSLPENYFRATGKKLIDVSKPWFFDHNPYVLRDAPATEVRELWNFGPQQYEWPYPREAPEVYTCNAEIWASLYNVPVKLNRPRLYQYEDYPFEKREMILFHTVGKSHGTLSEKVIDHVIRKYQPTGMLYQIGLPTDPDLGIRRLLTPNLWDLASLISKARMVIGVDSGPCWVAACYPDVVVKKIRNRPIHGVKPYSEWVPLEIENIHSHWEDRCMQIFLNDSYGEEDLQYMSSYKKI